jgi:hypothetical protein
MPMCDEVGFNTIDLPEHGVLSAGRLAELIGFFQIRSRSCRVKGGMCAEVQCRWIRDFRLWTISFRARGAFSLMVDGRIIAMGIALSTLLCKRAIRDFLWRKRRGV